MTAQPLPTQNGAAAGQDRSLPSGPWLRESVQQFFGDFNWENNPPEVQQVKLASLQASAAPLSLMLTVSQFFAAFNWDGAAIAAAASPAELAAEAAVEVTIDDFFSQF